MITELASPETPVAPPVEKTKRNPWKHRWLYLMLLPGLAYFLVFRYWPMYGLTIAFQDYLPFLGYSGSPWVGLKHFEELFTGPDFGRLMVNTLVLALLTLLFVFPAPIVVALLLNEVRHGVVKRSVQSLIYIPHFLSWTIVASLTYLLFSVDFGVIANWIHGIVGGQKTHVADLTPNAANVPTPE